MSLLQMSVTGAVMISAIAVIRALAIYRVPKKTFLALWGVALVRLLIPFSLPSGLSIYSLLKRETPALAGGAAAVRLLPPAVSPGQAAPRPIAAPAAAVSVWEILWAAGLILCAAFFAASYWRCYREFQTSLPVENDFCRRWLRAHPLRRTVSIRQSDRVSSPLTFGALRPVILLPKKTDWENEHALQYVLEHELVHIRRFDTVSKLLLIAAVCVHWLNPLVWAMYVLANRDMELSCDETVVRRFGGARADYANVLIHMEETKRGFAPLCNHFSTNAIEERITAIMKTRKTTLVSLAVAAALVAGTTTVFATSAKNEEHSASAAFVSAAVESSAESAASAAGTMETFQTGEGLKPDTEYLAAGITAQENTWYYQGKPIAAIFDDNGHIYMNDAAVDGIYLNIQRDGRGGIAAVSAIAKKQFRELAGRYMNRAGDVGLTEVTLLSYVDPADGKTYYSTDGGATFEPLTDAEFEARYPTPDIEWWTYDEYKAWLENEKAVLQSMLGEKAWTSGKGSFVWTQDEIDNAIALYEGILENIKNGALYSKTVDGQDGVMLSYNSAGKEVGTASAAKELYIRLANGEGKTFGPYETDEELLAAVRPFCMQQIQLGNMTQSEADEILGRYAAK